MDDKYTIGEKIKQKRLSLNLRMEDVARCINVTRSTLSSIENGKGNYSIETLLDVLSFLGLSFHIGNQKKTNARSRATRTNSALDKKINRFIIMCVEQYASSMNKDSKTTYEQLSEKGIIKELFDDYEDMHGMSTHSINEYIKARLRSGL